MLKYFFSFCFCVLLSTAAAAQNAQKVLEATAQRLTGSGDVRAQFKVTQFSGTTPQGDAQGTILISGRKFQMVTDELTTWFDGQTQWTMLSNSNEVNVAMPNEEEQAAMNPAILVNIYKKGYRSSMTKSELRGKPTYVVHLTAKTKKASFSDIFVDVEQSTFNPLCIRAKKDGDWMRLAILTFQNGLKLPASTFIFPKSDFPSAEIIDLR